MPPLLWADELAKQEIPSLLIVEGEKAAQAVRDAGITNCVTTWAGGTGAVAKADWGAVAGREVVLWADADAVGRKAMKRAAQICDEAGAASVRLILPEGMSGDDAADLIAADLITNGSDLRAYIEANAEAWNGEPYPYPEHEPEPESEFHQIPPPESEGSATGEDGSDYEPLTLEDLTIDVIGALDDPDPVTLWATEAGSPLMARGQRCWIYGPPDSFKTWAALVCAAYVIAAGGTVVLLDWESGPRRIARRLASAGILEAAHSDGRPLDESLLVLQVERLWQLEASLAYRELLERVATDPADPDAPPTLVIVDSASASGLERDTGAGINEWAAKCVNPFWKQGAAVIVIDHVARGRGSAGGPVGTGDKGAQADIAYSAAAAADGGWGRERDGAMILSLAKDRDDLWPKVSCSLEKPKPVAIITGRHETDSDDPVLVLRVRDTDPTVGATTSGAAEAKEALERLGGESPTKRALAKAMSGRQDARMSAINEAVSAGLIIESKAANRTSYELPAAPDTPAVPPVTPYRGGNGEQVVTRSRYPPWEQGVTGVTDCYPEGAESGNGVTGEQGAADDDEPAELDIGEKP